MVEGKELPPRSTSGNTRVGILDSSPNSGPPGAAAVHYVLEESSGYMEPALRILAVLHTVISFFCIIGYYCLKVRQRDEVPVCLSVCTCLLQAGLLGVRVLRLMELIWECSKNQPLWDNGREQEAPRESGLQGRHAGQAWAWF